MFRSKYKGDDLVRDDKRPKLKKVQRPCFSKYPGCWIVDHVIKLGVEGNHIRTPVNWIWLINMNTRYLFIYPAGNFGGSEVYTAYKQLSAHLEAIGVRGDENGEYIKNITGDGAKAYQHRDIIQALKQLKVTYYFSSSPYTNHNRILDRSVRTIRDAFAYRREPTLQEVLAVVELYNNTYHKAIDCTPKQMMLNPEWEWQYIRWCNEKVRDVKRNQEEYLHYKPGNILFLHLDESKTQDKFTKKRRYWNNIGVFIKYLHGNVVVRLLQDGYVIEVPIYYTKLCPEGLTSTVRREYAKLM
jgi:hypothetical protein